MQNILLHLSVALIYPSLCRRATRWKYETTNERSVANAKENRLSAHPEPPQYVVAIFHKKYCIRVASQVAELLEIYDLRKLGKIRKMSKLGGDSALSLCSRTKLL